jgi:hypothetical protein
MRATALTIWCQLAHIILVSPAVNVIHILHFASAKVVGASANRVLACSIAVLGLVDAVAFAVEVIVPLCLYRIVVRIEVVRVTGVHGVVVVGLVLHQRVKPSIANQDVLEIDFHCTGDILCVLVQEVRTKYWSVVWFP